MTLPKNAADQYYPTILLRQYNQTALDTSDVVAWYDAEHTYKDRRFRVPAASGDDLEIIEDISGHERHMFPASQYRITRSAAFGYATVCTLQSTDYEESMRTYQHFPSTMQIGVAYSPTTTWDGYGVLVGRYSSGSYDRTYLFNSGWTGAFYSSPEGIQRRNGVAQSVGDRVNPIDQRNIYVFGHRNSGLAMQWTLGKQDNSTVALHIFEVALFSSIPALSVIEEWEQYFSEKYDIPLGV